MRPGTRPAWRPSVQWAVIEDFGCDAFFIWGSCSIVADWTSSPKRSVRGSVPALWVAR
jgi:hypothetical protein